MVHITGRHSIQPGTGSSRLARSRSKTSSITQSVQKMIYNYKCNAPQDVRRFINIMQFECFVQFLNDTKVSDLTIYF